MVSLQRYRDYHIILQGQQQISDTQNHHIRRPNAPTHQQNSSTHITSSPPLRSGPSKSPKFMSITYEFLAFISLLVKVDSHITQRKQETPLFCLPTTRRSGPPRPGLRTRNSRTNLGRIMELLARERRGLICMFARTEG